ncbi:apoptosis-inducing factor 3-like isoform X2 [Protopterus annectens]|nr:apoptosis-inducing factor 3-like isoform X2 [Protopterus annectens]XP_043910295.1 apoptosis-inducing factor 3-like isoform X2 [Protopterus annectens]XP_043910296.1 apoptosis-inducing factor 3-like isoform X2 [Protopterus annectens]
MATEDEFTKEVCLETDMQDGEMREVEMNEQKVLLVKINGSFSAVGSKCTHYGAPLIKGALIGHRVRCPWHGACFNVKTGDIEDYPGLDSLPCFKVKVENGKVLVTANKLALENSKRVKTMTPRDPHCSSTVLILGGGPAGLVCAETLRQEGYLGKIILATKEDNLPYDRTKLSKAMNMKTESILLRPGDFFAAHDIEVWTDKEAVAVNTSKKMVKFKDGSVQQYDQLLIATGSRPNKLKCSGADLENVLLRTPDDANKIHELSSKKNVLILGSSFIGMEVAAYLSDKAASVCVVGSSKVPFQAVLGSDIGSTVMKMLEEHGVKFYMENTIKELKGQNGKVKEAILKSGTVLPVDVVLTGIGVAPESAFLSGSGIHLDSKGFIIVDKHMQTNIQGVFAAGDVASFPLPLMNSKRVSIGHWQLALAQGRSAALNMLKRKEVFNSVPFFWTSLLGKSIRYAGYGEGFTEIIMKGNPKEMKFLAFYIREENVVAVSSMNFDPAVARIAEILASGKQISKAEAQSSEEDKWLKHF